MFVKNENDLAANTNEYWERSTTSGRDRDVPRTERGIAEGSEAGSSSGSPRPR